MLLLLSCLQLVFLFLATLSIAYFLVSILAAERFFHLPAKGISPSLPPVSVLIPLCGTDPDAYENYSSFCRQDYATFQLIFGVRDSNDPAVEVVRKIQKDFPGVDSRLVINPHSIGHNLKVGNLHNMLQESKYEHLVIVDSDIQVSSDYLQKVISELQEENVGLVTCLYRVKHPPDWAARFEAIGVSSEFQAGVLTARLIEGVKFGLGATLATTRTTLKSVGGFESIADYLGDDYMLGYLVSQSGQQVCLSHCLVETSAQPGHFWAMIRHQVRWARGIRVCRPASYWGLIFTHGTATSLFFALLTGFSPFGLLMLLTSLLVRFAMAWRIGVHWLRDQNLRRFFWLVPLRDLVSFGIWLLSLGGRQVEWRGILFELVGDGKIVAVGNHKR
jgi:ceramide glucosyltransferase